MPGDYDTLKRYYPATWDLSEKWRQLYLDAEASVTELRESNARLLAMVEAQRKELETLRNRGPSFGLVGGATWSKGSGPGVFGGAFITF